MIGTSASGGDYKFVDFKEYDIGYAQGTHMAENAKQNAKVCYVTDTAGREAVVD